VYIYSIPPDDELQICPKHGEVDWRNKLRINSTSSWFLLHSYFFFFFFFFFTSQIGLRVLKYGLASKPSFYYLLRFLHILLPVCLYFVWCLCTEVTWHLQVYKCRAFEECSMSIPVSRLAGEITLAVVPDGVSYPTEHRGSLLLSSIRKVKSRSGDRLALPFYFFPHLTLPRHTPG